MNDNLDVYSDALARSESALIEAEQAADQAAAHVDLLRDRLASQAARIEQIRADLEDKKLTPPQAGGLVHLANQDHEDIVQMLVAADNDAQAAQRAVETSRERRDMAQQALSRAESAIEFDALSRRVAAIESTLTSAIGELFRLATLAGKPRDLASVWRPSTLLYRAVALRVPPSTEPS